MASRRKFDPRIVDAYNRWIEMEYDRVRDFLILHYHATERDDAPIWNYCRTMDIPDSLAHKMELFRARARVVTYKDGLFLEPSWLAVYFGQRVMPRGYDPRADAPDAPKLRASSQRVREQIQSAVARMPTHEEFLRQYCPAAPRAGNAGVARMSDHHAASIVAGSGPWPGSRRPGCCARVRQRGARRARGRHRRRPMRRVGRWTLPSQRGMHALLGIAEPHFMQRTGATFKLATEHLGWQGEGSRFLHAHGEIGTEIGGTPFYKFLQSEALAGRSEHARGLSRGRRRPRASAGSRGPWAKGTR